MKSYILFFIFISICFGGKVFAGNPTSTRSVDLSFMSKFSPEGRQLYIGKVLAIEKPWFSDKKQQKVVIKVEKFLAGGGKMPPEKITLTGRFSDFFINHRYIIVNSPPAEIVAILPYDNDDYDLIELIEKRIKEDIKRTTIVGKLQTEIFEKLKPKWKECRVYQVGRPLYMEHYDVEYTSQSGTVQFIQGSINSYKEPSITINDFRVQNEGDETLIVTGLIMPERQNYNFKIHYSKSGQVQIKEFKLWK